MFLFCQSINYECSADSWVRINSTCGDWVTTNYGTYTMMQCNAWTYSYLGCGTGFNRALVQFDLNADVESNKLYDNRATLLLYYPLSFTSETQNFLGGADNNIIIVSRIIDPWSEMTVTWQNQPSSDIANPVIVPSTDDIPSFEDYAIDVSDIVDDWICSTSTNYGFMLQLLDESIYRRVSFATREYPDANKHPVLKCEYASIFAVAPSESCGNFNLQCMLTNAQIPANYSFVWTHLNSGTIYNTQNVSNPIFIQGNNTYVVSVTNSYCQQAFDTVVVNVSESQSYDFEHDFAICSNGNSTIDLNLDSFSVLWQDGTVGDVFKPEQGSGYYSLTITDGACVSLDSVYIEIIPFIGSYEHDFSMCNSSPSIIYMNDEDLTYHWEDGTDNSFFYFPSSGFYNVTVTDNTGCSISDSVSINVIDFVPDYQNQFYICNNEICEINLHLPDLNYIWQDGSTDSLFYATEPGVYSVTLSDNQGCTNIGSISVSQTNLYFDYEIVAVSCAGLSDGQISIILIGGSPPYSFAVNDSLYQDSVISNLSYGSYNIVAIDSNNCQYGVSNVLLLDGPDKNCIKIPNAFTPNGDGPNDTWIIENIEFYPDAIIRIFNRWGQELWLANGADSPWNGFFNGKKVPTGPYLYIVDLLNGSKPYVGTVTVVY